MKIVKFFEDKFWLMFVFVSILGLVTPSVGKNFIFLIVPLIMLLFLFTCLKVDFFDVLSHVKKPLFIVYVLIFNLLLIPVMAYGIFQFLTPELAIGMLLLASVPPGPSAPVLADIFKGNTALSLAITLLSYLISPFTIIALLFIFTQRYIPLDLYTIFKTLVLINFLPLIASQIIRKINKPLIEKTKGYFSLVNIFGIALILYIAVSSQAVEILKNPLYALTDILWLYVLFIILFLFGYFLGFRKQRTDRITLAVTKGYMNNMLLLGVVTAYFSPKIVLLFIISEIPWGTVTGAFKFMLKFLK